MTVVKVSILSNMLVTLIAMCRSSNPHSHSHLNPHPNPDCPRVICEILSRDFQQRGEDSNTAVNADSSQERSVEVRSEYQHVANRGENLGSINSPVNDRNSDGNDSAKSKGPGN